MSTLKKKGITDIYNQRSDIIHIAAVKRSTDQEFQLEICINFIFTLNLDPLTNNGSGQEQNPIHP